MKVLVYNFVQPDGKFSKVGGGVSIYLGNLISSLLDSGHEIICMSAGERYSPKDSAPSIRFFRQAGYERAVVLDSPVMAPSHINFQTVSEYYTSKALDHIPALLRDKHGSIDVFHFQNIEGLTSSFFQKLREEFPKSKIILSAHNYNIVCPQVNLWHQESQHCEDFKNGESCVNCKPRKIDVNQERRLRRVYTLLEHFDAQPTSESWQRVVNWETHKVGEIRPNAMGESAGEPSNPLKPTGSAMTAAEYKRYRTSNIELCHSVFDEILAVSQRTQDVLIANGVPRQKISVSYIGTGHYKKFATARRRVAIGDGLHIAFLGYMRLDKGFFMFLESLGTMPDSLASKISVTIAAPNHFPAVAGYLRNIAHKFRDITLHNGYTQENIESILETVDLGIVPVLWEDNLPQVAIEFVAHGIPVLTADRGGAQEIARNKDFIFKSGSQASLYEKLGALAEKRVKLSDFWTNEIRIFSMTDHVADLMKHYASCSRQDMAQVDKKLVMDRRIDADFLTRHAWRFSRGDGSLISPILRLLPRGIVGGHTNPSERSWEMRGDHLALLDFNDVASTLFSEVQFDALGPVKMKGTYLGDGKTIHLLERTKMPSGIDLGQHSRQEPVEFLRRTKNPPNGTIKKNLVILRANEKSTHIQWPQDIPDTEKNWDLCISWYGKEAPPADLACDYLTWQSEDKKFGAIHALFLNDSPLWEYEHFWMPDDDLIISWASINRLFAIFRRYDFDLAQPALSAAGHVTHDVTRENPKFSLRYTNFVEGMCPLLSKEALRICLPSMNGAISGWGLDRIWPSLLGNISSKIAVIDEVVAIHTRPFGTGTNYNMKQAELECDRLRALYGAPFHANDCGGLAKGSSAI